MKLTGNIKQRWQAIGVVKSDGHLSDDEFFTYLVYVENYSVLQLEIKIASNPDWFYGLKREITAVFKEEIKKVDEDNMNTKDGTGEGCHGRYYGQLNRCAECDSWLCKRDYEEKRQKE